MVTTVLWTIPNNNCCYNYSNVNSLNLLFKYTGTYKREYDSNLVPPFGVIKLASVR